MSEYTPDYWVVLKVHLNSDVLHYRILAGWVGGFAEGHSWKISSGIESVSHSDGMFTFPQTSGSIYRCYEHCERLNSYMSSIFDNYKKDTEEGEVFEIIGVEKFLDEYGNEKEG
jgi:hypothetical protein